MCYWTPDRGSVFPTTINAHIHGSLNCFVFQSPYLDTLCTVSMKGRIAQNLLAIVFRKHSAIQSCVLWKIKAVANFSNDSPPHERRYISSQRQVRITHLLEYLLYCQYLPSSNHIPSYGGSGHMVSTFWDPEEFQVNIYSKICASN